MAGLNVSWRPGVESSTVVLSSRWLFKERGGELPLHLPYFVSDLRPALENGRCCLDDNEDNFLFLVVESTAPIALAVAVAAVVVVVVVVVDVMFGSYRICFLLSPC